MRLHFKFIFDKANELEIIKKIILAEHYVMTHDGKMSIEDIETEEDERKYGWCLGYNQALNDILKRIDDLTKGYYNEDEIYL